MQEELPIITDPVQNKKLNEVVDDLNLITTPVELKTIETVLEDPAKQTIGPKTSNLLPSQDTIEDNYTTLYGKPNQTFGERIPSQLTSREEYDYAIFDESFEKTWSAAFRQYNFVPALQRMIEGMDPKYNPVPGYDAFQNEELKKEVGSDDALWMFRHDSSPAETRLRMDRMKKDAEDQAYLSAVGGTDATIAASLATPFLFTPLASVNTLKMASPLKRFIGGSLQTAAITAPETLLIESQNESRDASYSVLALTGLSLVGGTLAAKYPKAMMPAAYRNAANSDDAMPRSVGAAAPIDRKNLSKNQLHQLLEEEALVETGVGLEKLPWNPVIRLLKSGSLLSRQLASELVDVGGMMQKKVGKDIAQEQSVESIFKVKYIGPLLKAINETDMSYLKYRGVKASEGAIGRSVQKIKISLSDKIDSGSQFLTEVQFRHRVGKAMRNGDVDTVTDSATPFVNSAAASNRKVFNFIKDEANKYRLFDDQLKAEINAAIRSGNEALAKRLTEKLQTLREQGVLANNGASYLPRIYRIDKIMERSTDFLRIIESYARTTLRMDAQSAKVYAQNVMDTVTRQRPYFDLDDVADGIDFVRKPDGIKSRTLEIPDQLIDDFLENDVEVLLRHHTKTMGIDIELTAKFGSIDMSSLIKQVTDEYELLIKEAKNAEARRKLKKALDNDIRDIKGLRDRVRGTYGASKDPHQLSSRFVRSMKSFNVLVGMGGAVIASVPDIARSVMVEGFSNTYRYGFEQLFRDIPNHIKRMKKAELEAAAVSADAVLGLRANSFSDIGDLFGSRFALERKLNQATGVFFMLNGLNYWNQALKEFAGNVTMARMNKSIMTVWEGLSKAEKEKLLKNGIDRADAYRIRSLIQKHGRKYNNVWLPNTDKWEDATMRLKYRIALQQNVDRIIVTPGAGDRALWTSTELGSLMTQFKSYGQGAMVRLATAGLQERDGAFWQGAFLLVGLAALVNEIKRAQYGMDNEEAFDDKLVNAIDRSGILGWFTDVNNAVEKITDYKMGMRPMFTDQPEYALPDKAKIGGVFGPAASNLLNAGSVMSDIVTFNADEQTLKDARFITPGSTLPYLDPIYDGVFGD